MRVLGRRVGIACLAAASLLSGAVQTTRAATRTAAILLPGSIVAVMSRARWEFADKALVAKIVMQAGREIADRVLAQ